MFLGEQFASKPSEWGSNPHPGAKRRARQMVSQHTANVPSAHARLGSIPRLSAKLVSKKVRVSGGYDWPRLPVEQSAPSERPGSNPGTPTTRPRSPTGRGNRLKIGKVWVRLPAGPPPGFAPRLL